MKRALFYLLNHPPLLIFACLFVNLVVGMACPNVIVPPPLSAQRAKILTNLIICSIPLLWTILLIIFGRDRVALTLALINLVPSVLWLVYAVPLFASAFNVPNWGPSFWIHFLR
jgi:hypothetical protein